jgi:hypothetical protein
MAQREYGRFGMRLCGDGEAEMVFRLAQQTQLSSPATGSRECAPDDRLQRVIQYSRDGH